MQKDVSSLIKTALIEYVKSHDEYNGKIMDFTMEENLNSLSKNIDKADLSYNTYIQGLLTPGLVYQSVIGGNCDSKYSFTPLAESVDRFAVSYDNVERYPNPMKINDNCSSPQTQISGIPEWEEISESDNKKMF